MHIMAQGLDAAQCARRAIDHFVLLTSMLITEAPNTLVIPTSNDYSDHQSESTKSNAAGGFLSGWRSADNQRPGGTASSWATVPHNNDVASNRSSLPRRMLKNAVAGAMLAASGCLAGMTIASLAMSIPGAAVKIMARPILVAAVAGGAIGGVFQNLTAGWRASMTGKVVEWGAGAIDKVRSWGASMIHSIKSHWPFK